MINWRECTLFYTASLQKLFRSKVLLGMLIFTIVVFVCSKLALDYFNEFITEAMPQGTSQDIGLAIKLQEIAILFTFFWTGILAIYIPTATIRTDINNKTIVQLLSLPIKRVEYLLSAIASSITVVLAYFLISLLLLALLFSIKIGFDNIAISFLIIIPSLLTTVVLCSFFSLFFNSIVSMLFTLATEVVLVVSASVVKELDAPQNFGHILAYIFYYCFPRENFWSNEAVNALEGKEMAPLFLEFSHYGLTFTLLFFLLNKIFSRREF